MAQNNWLNRATKMLVENVDLMTMKERYVGDFDAYESNVQWIYDPDLSAVAGWANKYWLIAAFPLDAVSLMSQAERDLVDENELSDSRDEVMQQLEDLEDLLRAVVLIIMDEINLLREENGWAERTVQQLKNAIRNRLGQS